jgi:hypothetical protein
VSPPCARSKISSWRDGALYPLAGRRRIMPELEATAPPIPFWFYRVVAGAAEPWGQLHRRRACNNTVARIGHGFVAWLSHASRRTLLRGAKPCWERSSHKRRLILTNGSQVSASSMLSRCRSTIRAETLGSASAWRIIPSTIPTSDWRCTPRHYTPISVVACLGVLARRVP